MPPKKLAPPSVLKGEILRKEPPTDAVVKKDSHVSVKTDTLPEVSKGPPSSPVAAAKIKLPVQQHPTKRPLPVSPAVPLSSAISPAPGGTAAAGPTGQPSLPSASLTSSVPTTGAHAAGVKSVDNLLGKTPLLPPGAATSTSVITSKAADASASASSGPDVKVKMLPTTPAKTGPTVPLGKPGAVPSSVAGAPAIKEKPAPPAPPGKKGPPIPTEKPGGMPSPAAGAPAIKGKAAPAPPAKKGPPISTEKPEAVPSPAAGAPATKEKPAPAPPAKKGPPIPTEKPGAVPSSAAGAPAIKEKPAPAPPAKKGPPIPTEKPGAVPSPAAGAPAIKEKLAPGPPAKKGPPVAVAKPAPKPAAPGAAAPTTTPATTAAPGSPVGAPRPVTAGGGPLVRVKTGIVGVGPPPGVHPKMVRAEREGDITPAATVTAPPKNGGVPPGAVGKVAPLQKTVPSPVPAVAAGAEKKAADKRLSVAGLIGAAITAPASAREAPEPPSVPPAQPGSPRPDASLCKIVDVSGKLVGYAHGPPSPLRLQDPSSRGVGTEGRRSGALWLADRAPVLEPLPYSSRSMLQARRAGFAADGRRMKNVQYLSPFGMPPGWESLPGFFFPMPAWPPYLPAGASAGFPAKPMRQPPERGTSERRSGEKRVRQGFRGRLEQPAGRATAPAAGDQWFYPPMSCYHPTPTHPFFAYPYYTAACDMDPYSSGFQGQQQMQQPRGPLPYDFYPYAGYPVSPPLPRTEKDSRRRRSSALRGDEALGSSDGTPSYPPSDRDEDPLRMTVKSTACRRRSDASDSVGVSVTPRRNTRISVGETETRQRPSPRRKLHYEAPIEPLTDLIGEEAAYRPPVPRGQRRASGETFEDLDQPTYETDWSPAATARMFRRQAADSGSYGQTPWTRLERKLNHIRGGYGLNPDVNPEALRAHVEPPRQREKGDKGGRYLLDGPRSAPQEGSAFPRKRSSRRPSWQEGYSCGYAEDQQEAEDLLSGDQYYKLFNTRYQPSKKPWLEEVVPRRGSSQQKEPANSLSSSAASSPFRRTRRGWDRWGFEAGLTAPRRRTYQSLNELAAHFSHIEGEDQDELISLLLLCRRLERQIEEQHLVVDMLEHELATASATLKFPPEWRALEGIDLVSLVPADSAFQPSAAAPLFLKSTVLLPKQLADGSSAFSDAPARPVVDTAPGKLAPAAAPVGAPSPKVDAGTGPSSAAAGKPATTVKPEPSPAAGPAKTLAKASPGVAGAPKPPPPSVGVKKATKVPGVVKKPTFKTSIKAK